GTRVRTVPAHLGNPCADAAPQPFDERRGARDGLDELGARQAGGHPEADDARDVLRPGAPAALLRTARDRRGQIDAAAHVQRAHTGRPAVASARAVSRTDACSIAVVTSAPALPAPRSARLFASVAPLVKTISAGVAPTSAATSARAASTALRARAPSRCALDGFAGA